ncbi:MAG: YfiR family protein [Bacteroidota bacterium]
MNRNLLAGVLFLMGAFIAGHEAQAQESKFKALFLYKFSEYIEWPNSEQNIVVGVIGKSDVYDELVTFAASRDNLTVIKINGASELDKCNILFVPSGQERIIGEVAPAASQKSVLIVSDTDKQVGSGSDIGFYLEQNKLRFLISKGSIESKKMTPSTKLLALGKVI